MLPLVLLLPTCTLIGRGTKPVPSNGCEWAKPILVSSRDTLTQGTSDQIDAYNRKWAQVCNHGKPYK